MPKGGKRAYDDEYYSDDGFYDDDYYGGIYDAMLMGVMGGGGKKRGRGPTKADLENMDFLARHNFEPDHLYRGTWMYKTRAKKEYGLGEADLRKLKGKEVMNPMGYDNICTQYRVDQLQAVKQEKLLASQAAALEYAARNPNAKSVLKATEQYEAATKALTEAQMAQEDAQLAPSLENVKQELNGWRILRGLPMHKQGDGDPTKAAFQAKGYLMAIGEEVCKVAKRNPALEGRLWSYVVRYIRHDKLDGTALQNMYRKNIGAPLIPATAPSPAAALTTPAAPPKVLPPPPSDDEGEVQQAGDSDCEVVHNTDGAGAGAGAGRGGRALNHPIHQLQQPEVKVVYAQAQAPAAPATQVQVPSPQAAQAQWMQYAMLTPEQQAQYLASYAAYYTAYYGQQ